MVEAEDSKSLIAGSTLVGASKEIMFESKFQKFMKGLFTFTGNILIGIVVASMFAFVWTIILTGAYWLFTGADEVHETAQGIFIVAFFVGLFIHVIRIINDHRL